jgi:hypothetical protein
MKASCYMATGKLSRGRRCLLILACALLASCDVLAPTELRARTELERAWRTWQARDGISYSYVQQRLCYCLIEATAAVRITVLDGAVVDRRYTSLQTPVPVQLSTIWGTVDDLFLLIDDALNNRAHSLLVTYHQRLGYPTHIAVDYSARVADDELTITASDLKVTSTAPRTSVADIR